MVKVIGVQFQKNGKLYHFDANGLMLSLEIMLLLIQAADLIWAR